MRFQILAITGTILALLLSPASGAPTNTSTTEIAESAQMHPYPWGMPNYLVQEIPVYGLVKDMGHSIGIVKFCKVTRFKDWTRRMGQIHFAEVECYDYTESRCVQDLVVDWWRWAMVKCKTTIVDPNNPSNCPGKLKASEYWNKDPPHNCERTKFKITDHFVTTRNRLSLIDTFGGAK